MTFEPGQVIERREVLRGQLWLTHPVTVIKDDGEMLAVRLDPGSPFTFPPHPFGVHPWAHQEAWGGMIALQLYRTGDLYSVWRFFEPDGTALHWYINFESVLVRGPAHIDTEDYGLDLIIDADETRTWKDVTDLHHQRAEGRISADTVLDVLASAAQIESEISAGALWWSRWHGWSPRATR